MDQLSIIGVEPAPQRARRKREVRATRGDYYGIKATPLSKDAQAKLMKIRVKIAKLQEPWAEADAMIEAATERALQALDDLIQQYKDSAEYMNEPMDE